MLTKVHTAHFQPTCDHRCDPEDAPCMPSPVYHEPCPAKIIQIPQKVSGETLAVQSLQPPPLNGCYSEPQSNFLLSNGPPPRDPIGRRVYIEGDRWSIVQPGSKLSFTLYAVHLVVIKRSRRESTL